MSLIPVPRTPYPVLEHSVSAPRVDRASRVLRGVKVLGLTSTNTGRALGLDPKTYGPALDRPYRYDPSAVSAAVPLYEGIAVNIDHPEARRPTPKGRHTADRFGRLVNVRVTEDGLVADLEYLAAHPLAEMILETAERMPEQLPLSHHARCEFALERGEVVAKKIVAVHSVDVIGDRPGTTRSLFESVSLDPLKKENRLKTLQNWIDTLPADTTAGRCLRRLVASRCLTAETVLESVAVEATPFQVLDAALRTALEALLSMNDLPAALAQLRPVWESLADSDLEQENRRLHARETARTLLDAAGVKTSEPVVKAVAALESAADRDALIMTLATTGLRARSREPRADAPLERFERPNGTAFAQLARA